MAIKSTGQSIKSTGQRETSRDGGMQAPRAGHSDGNPHPNTIGDPDRGDEGKAVIEYREKIMGDGNAEGVSGPGNFKGSDAAREDLCTHPEPGSDPAMHAQGGNVAAMRSKRV